MGIVFENGIRYFYRQGGEGMNKKKEALKLVERVARVKLKWKKTLSDGHRFAWVFYISLEDQKRKESSIKRLYY